MPTLMVAPGEGDVKAKARRQKAKGKRHKAQGKRQKAKGVKGVTDPVCFFIYPIDLCAHGFTW